jgi:hypothetical protein
MARRRPAVRRPEGQHLSATSRRKNPNADNKADARGCTQIGARLNDLSVYVIGCARSLCSIRLGVGFLEKLYESALAQGVGAASVCRA